MDAAKPVVALVGALGSTQADGTNTDFEDHNRAEDALRASENRFRLIVDNMPSAL